MSEGKRSYADSLGLLLIRAVVGVVFIYHGSQKMFGAFGGPGIEGFAKILEGMGIPQPMINAYLAGGAEFFGGILLILGLFTRIAAIPLVITMIVGIYSVHRHAFGLKPDNGMEYALTLGCVCVGIALLGPGCFSLDSLFRKKKPADG